MTVFQGQQTSVFNPANLESEQATLVSPRRWFSKSALVRYEVALQDLREQLSTGEFVAIDPAEFSKKHKITSTFLYALFRMQAVDRMRKNKLFHFKELPVLGELETRAIPDAIRDLAVLSEMEFNRKWHKTEAEEAEPETTEEKPQETYLVGLLSDGVLSVHIKPEYRFSDYGTANDSLNNFTCNPGQKIVLVKVMDVVEPVRIMQQSTL